MLYTDDQQHFRLLPPDPPAPSSLLSLARSDVLEELVKLVTLEPENNVEDKVKFKCVSWPAVLASRKPCAAC